SHALDVSCMVRGGQLELWIAYSSRLHASEEVELLLSSWCTELERLCARCVLESGYTPSDFPLSGLGQRELDALSARWGGRRREVSSMYPLSPLQEGMLFHSLYAPE